MRGLPSAPGRCLRAARSSSAAAGRAAAAAAAGPDAGWEVVVGLETHVQLNTATKAFCGCANAYGAPPNTHVCPVCVGLPGTLPVLNRSALSKAVLLGRALNCRLDAGSRFDRKQYFYADLPKGFQISQHNRPLATGGWLDVALPAEHGGGGSGGGAPPPPPATLRVGVSRAHLEEDSGKLVHSGGSGGGLAGSSHSLADYNRAGAPLVEVVTDPQLRSGREAAAYAAELQRLVRFLGVSDGNMEQGSLRCDVNVSVRRRAAAGAPPAPLGAKVEVKNLNSFSAMARAVDFEAARQAALLEGGGRVARETRLWDEAGGGGGGRTVGMRAKEGLADYRYLPEPDLGPAPAQRMVPGGGGGGDEALPELPAQMRARYAALGLPPADVALLADGRDVSAYYDAALAAGADPKPAANWVMGELTAAVNADRGGAGFAGLALTPAALAELTALVGDGTISGKVAKDLLPTLLREGGSPAALVESRGLRQISDAGELLGVVEAVLRDNAPEVAKFRAGKDRVKGYLVGQAMKRTGGRANPALIERLMLPLLKGPD